MKLYRGKEKREKKGKEFLVLISCILRVVLTTSFPAYKGKERTKEEDEDSRLKHRPESGKSSYLKYLERKYKTGTFVN